MAETSGERIGIVGVGRMGLAMAKHLLRHGYGVAACDLDKKQCDAARAAGADIVGTPAELGKLARFVIIGVGYDEEVNAVMHGPHGVLGSLPAGAITPRPNGRSTSSTRRSAAAAGSRTKASCSLCSAAIPT